MRRTWVALFLTLALAPAPARAACPSVAEVAQLAAAILDRRTPPAPRGDLTMADALCARDRLVAVLAQPWGDQVGWKVAPGGEGARLSGALFHGTLRERPGLSFPPGGAPILPARYGATPMLAPGLLLRIRDEGVNEAGEDPVALLRHIEVVIPFLELADLAYGPGAPWSPALRLSVNLGTRLGVLGEPVAAEATPAFAQALEQVAIALSDGTGPLAQGSSAGTGAAGVGHPLAALAWLVRELKEQGRRLNAQDHVAIAGLVPLVPAVPGDFTATFAGLGPRPLQVGVQLR
ncbi:hypothetical protein [Falsiroseomonas oryzae]|uniref:hypothetical protein n=1 Tax=Falsiroseomonas oryzae TaxID=2766473 RepID=UPI0022EB0626|nr:hypothetical protein [Roseomonas sp. MO-31]